MDSEQAFGTELKQSAGPESARGAVSKGWNGLNDWNGSLFKFDLGCQKIFIGVTYYVKRKGYGGKRNEETKGFMSNLIKGLGVNPYPYRREGSRL